MKPSRMYDMMRYHLDVGRNFFPGELVEAHLHAAQQEIVRLIVQQDPSFFVATCDLDLVAGQGTYALPANARLGTRIIFGENRSSDTTSVGADIGAADLHDLLSFEGSGIVNLCNTWGFAMENGKVRILPTPSSSLASAVRMWYVPTHGNMIEGLATAGASTTVVLFSGDPNYSSSFGELSTRDDYYNDMQIQMLDGSAAGDVRIITDYDGGTRQVTVDSAWTANPADGDTFAILCPVPEDFHDLVPLRAAILGSARNRNRQKELEGLYYGSGLNTTGRQDELLGWVSRRQDRNSEVVGYNNTLEY